jgi:hypothetical protein
MSSALIGLVKQKTALANYPSEGITSCCRGAKHTRELAADSDDREMLESRWPTDVDGWSVI